SGSLAQSDSLATPPPPGFHHATPQSDPAPASKLPPSCVSRSFRLQCQSEPDRQPHRSRIGTPRAAKTRPPNSIPPFRYRSLPLDSSVEPPRPPRPAPDRKRSCIPSSADKARPADFRPARTPALRESVEPTDRDAATLRPSRSHRFANYILGHPQAAPNCD